MTPRKDTNYLLQHLKCTAVHHSALPGCSCSALFLYALRTSSCAEQESGTQSAPRLPATVLGNMKLPGATKVLTVL